MQSHNDQLSGALMRYQVCNFYISCHSLNSNGTLVLHDGRWNLKSLWLDRRLVLHKYRWERYCLAAEKLFFEHNAEECLQFKY